MNCFFGINRGEEQAANAGSQQWDYCVPKPNYAEVRARVGSAFAEKAHELADAVAVVQGLSKEATRLPGELVVAAFSCAVLLCGWCSLCAQQPGKIFSILWEWRLLSMICLMFGSALCRLLGEIDKQCS